MVINIFKSLFITSNHQFNIKLEFCLVIKIAMQLKLLVCHNLSVCSPNLLISSKKGLQSRSITSVHEDVQIMDVQIRTEKK